MVDWYKILVGSKQIIDHKILRSNKAINRKQNIWEWQNHGEHLQVKCEKTSYREVQNRMELRQLKQYIIDNQLRNIYSEIRVWNCGKVTGNFQHCA